MKFILVSVLTILSCTIIPNGGESITSDPLAEGKPPSPVGQIEPLQPKQIIKPKEYIIPVVKKLPEVPKAVAGCEQYRPLLAKYDWNVDTMMRIMSSESRCLPTNHNWTDNHGVCKGSFGLLQIGCLHGYSAAYLENPTNNITAAYKVWKSSSYGAWSTY